MPDPDNKAIKIGVPKESFPGEARVALIPDHIPSIAKVGLKVLFEKNAGVGSGFSDEQYMKKGAEIIDDREKLLAASDIILQVRGLGANLVEWKRDLPYVRPGQWLIGLFEPLAEPEAVAQIAETGVTAFAMELMPRITRAQSMDALSSMATIAGYKAGERNVESTHSLHCHLVGLHISTEHLHAADPRPNPNR